MFAKGVILFILLQTVHIFSLNVDGNPSSIASFINEQAKLICRFTLESGENVVTVEWFRERVTDKAPDKISKYEPDRDVPIKIYAADLQNRLVNGYVADVEASIFIGNLTLEDAAAYTCAVETTVIRSTVMTLQVNVKPKKPVITVTSNPQSVNEQYYIGDNLTFTCEGNTGKPSGSLVWYRNEEALTNQPPSGPLPQSDGTFVMKSTFEMTVTSDDNGAKYKCQTQNPVTPSSDYMSDEKTLNVLAFSQLTEDKVSLIARKQGATQDFTNFNEGDDVELVCVTTDAVPEPTYQWRFRKDAESSYEPVTTVSKILSRPKIKPENAGIYSCTASQSQPVGSNVDFLKEIIITVTKKPGGTAGIANVVASGLTIVSMALAAVLF